MQFKYCFNCGKRIKASAKFCPYCGKSQPQPHVAKPQLNVRHPKNYKISRDGSKYTTDDNDSMNTRITRTDTVLLTIVGVVLFFVILYCLEYSIV